MSSHREATKVLLMDDHEHVLWGLRKLIDGEWPRMTVIGTARTLSQAFTLIRQRKPDIIVIDIFVGTANCPDHPQDLRDASGAQILVLTASRDTGLYRRAMDPGARAVILKGEPADVLLRLIEQVRTETDTPDNPQ